MADPANLTALLTNPWPKAGSPGPAQATLAALLRETAQHICTLPTDFSAYGGQPVVAAANGSGLKMLADAGLGVFDFLGLGVKNNATSPLTISGSGLISWNAHLGQELVYAGSAAITLTINLDSTGALGVKTNFQCLIVRAYDGGSVGAVTIALGTGLANQRADGKVAVAPGGVVAVRVMGGRVWLSGSLA